MGSVCLVRLRLLTGFVAMVRVRIDDGRVSRTGARALLGVAKLEGHDSRRAAGLESED